MKKKLDKKSQIGMGDLFLAVTIFLVLIVSVIFIYNHYSENFESRQNFNRMRFSAFQETNLLVKSGGMPSDWESDINSTELIGLAYSSNDERNLSVQKVDGFLNLSYNKTKEIFGLRYDFYFRIMDISGNLLAEKGYNSTGKRAVSIERRVLYNNEEAILSMIFWE